MGIKLWNHHFLYDPEPARERDADEWDKAAQEWEDEDHRRANGDEPFAERSPA